MEEILHFVQDDNMSKPLISLIAALDDKNGVGKANGIPWHISEDFKHFKTTTTGHPVIMGRKTYESMGRVLPNRTNIVITQNINNFKPATPPHEVVQSLEAAIMRAKKAKGYDEIFIIGGGQIYKEAMEKGLVDRLYITKITGDYGCEVFFPDYSEFTKVISERKSSEGEYQYTFYVLEK